MIRSFHSCGRGTRRRSTSGMDCGRWGSGHSVWCGRREIYAGNRRVWLTCGTATMDLQLVDLRRRVDSLSAESASASGRAMRCAVYVRSGRCHRYSGRRINWMPIASKTLAVEAECTRCLETKWRKTLVGTASCGRRSNDGDGSRYVYRQQVLAGCPGTSNAPARAKAYAQGPIPTTCGPEPAIVDFPRLSQVEPHGRGFHDPILRQQLGSSP